MTDPYEPDHDPEETMADRAAAEIKGMAKQGMAHPGTKPMLTGMAIGAVAAAVLPVLTIPVGVVGGAAIALWQRVKR
ncbi:hypothetical protein [Flavisphingopyxis soli]|nr:hypothetical protein [Sphingorhabdus soli]